MPRSEWQKIHARLVASHGQRYILRAALRRDFGFTVRSQTTWTGYTMHELSCLDFYSEAAQSWFVLKYLHCSAETS